MKIVFCCSEAVPFAKTGGLADVCGVLPVVLEKLGLDVLLIMPRYKDVDFKKFSIKPLNNQVSTTSIGDHIQVYFIENTLYFDRDGLYGDGKGDYPDNLDRFQYFCRNTLQLLRDLNLRVDIIHAHDWQTALIPAYLKILYKEDSFFKNVKTVFTIHNMAYQGIFPAKEFSKLGLDRGLFTTDAFEFFHQVNLLKGGIIFSDQVTTVSPTYAQEIQTEKYGCGLEGVLRQRKDRVIGILNGLDHDFWDPKTDPFIEKKYSAQSPEVKIINKRRLQKAFHLPQKDHVPIFGFVGRLSYQKGLDLLAKTIDEIAQGDVQLALMGVGEERYQKALKEWHKKYPEKIGVHLKFDEETAHHLYAGSDIFLMPSVYEPCGISQMISLRYGAVPLVYKTGGLADTIQARDDHGAGNGFVFDHYDEKAFLKAVHQAMETYKNKKVFDELVKKAFTFDFSWDKSAKEYLKVYQQCLS